MRRLFQTVSGGIFVALLAACVHEGPQHRAAIADRPFVADFGLPVNVDPELHADPVAYARAVLMAQWEDGFEFVSPSRGAPPLTVTNCSALLSDEVSLSDVSPIHYWNTIQDRDRRCRAAALVAGSQLAVRSDWPDRILTPASLQLLPAEVMSRISPEQEERFIAHVADGNSRWVQHEQIEFVESDEDGRAEFLTGDGMRYWLAVLARADVTHDGREDVVLLVVSSPDGGSLRSHRLLVLETRDGTWWTAQEWDTRQ